MGEGIGGCWHDKGAYKCLHRGYDFPLQQPVTAQSPAPSMLEWWWAQSCADSLCCEFVVDWPYRVQKIAFHTSFRSLALAFFAPPFPQCDPELCVYMCGERNDMMSCFRLNSQQSCVLSPLTRYESKLTVSHCRKKLLWLRLRTVLIYNCKHKYLEDSLMPDKFSKTTVVDSLLGPMSLTLGLQCQVWITTMAWLPRQSEPVAV